MVDALEPRRLRAIEDFDPSPVAPSGTKKEPEPSVQVDRNYDDAIRAFASQSSKAPSPVTTNDRILYAGMNPESASKEFAALRSTGADVFGVKPVDIPDTRAFVMSLRLGEEQSNRIIEILDASPDDRAALGAIAKEWAVAERGGSAPSRLVLSGHSDGGEVHGGGKLVFDHLLKLAGAMPRAASFVEDIQLSGCNTALNATSSTERAPWLRAFPGLRTMWGYQGTCPTAPEGHMKAWEQQTRGRAERLVLDGSLIQANVTISDRTGHLDGRAVRKPMPQLQGELATAEKNYLSLIEGNWPAYENNPDNAYVPGGLYQTYQTFQEGAARDGISKSDVASYRTKAAQLLRMRYYEPVRKAFQATYGKTIGDGFKAAHMNEPDFSKLDRQQALKFCRHFMLATDGRTGAAIRDARALVKAFAELDPAVIPTDWCQR